MPTTVDKVVKTSCTDVSCLYNQQLGMCETCGKTLEEIGEFPDADQSRKRQITKFSKLRLKDYRNK